MRANTNILIAIACLIIASIACQAVMPENPVVPEITQPDPTIYSPSSEPVTPLPPISDEQRILRALYDRVSPGVVNITIYNSSFGAFLPEGQGSGFVYDTQGHIVTNAHVVQNAEEIEITFFDGRTRTGELVGLDLNSDLAVIKIADVPEEIQPIPLGNMEDIFVGQTVVAIGNPFGLQGTMTRGIVSALGRSIPALNTFSIPQAIQTDAPINPGNSGGPLLNLEGEIIGVNAQIETSNGVLANAGVGFAIPVSILKRVLPDLSATGKVAWSWLGVRGGSLNQRLAEANNLDIEQGAYLSQIIANGPAAKAGLQGTKEQSTFENYQVELGGDVIIGIDGQTIKSFDDLLIYIALDTRPGAEVTLTILREGKQLQVKVTLEQRPDTLE